MAGVAYEEPGWYTVTSDGKTIVSNNPAVTVSGNIDVNQLGLQTITYTWNVNGKSIVKKRNIYVTNTSLTYDYTGDYQVFTANVSGTYKVELWGAQGGGTKGGKGAYVSGYLALNEGEKLYVYVGGQGSESPSGRSSGGYNGGGKGYSVNTTYPGSGGGGSTDVRYFGNVNPKSNELLWNSSLGLKSRIIVAAGGGGYSIGNAGSNGGALNGLYTTGGSTGGTQTSGGVAASLTQNGTNGGFGFAGDSGAEAVGGGGSGYYGGAGASQKSSDNKGAPSGSSFISGYTGCVAIASVDSITPKAGCSNGTSNQTCSYHYSGIIFDKGVMKSGSEQMPTHDSKSSMAGNSGNGYAKITLISQQDATTINI
jgi:hypothetical protein